MYTEEHKWGGPGQIHSNLTSTLDHPFNRSMTLKTPDIYVAVLTRKKKTFKFSMHIQGVVIPIGAVITAATGVKKQSRAVFGVGQAVKDNFQTR